MRSSERETALAVKSAPGSAQATARSLPDKRKEEKRTEEKVRALLWRYNSEIIFGGSLEIKFTRNSSSLVSLSQHQGSGTLRLHELFCKAPTELLKDVIRLCFSNIDRAHARMLRSRIHDYIGANRHLAVATMSAPIYRRPQGSIYDLEEILKQVVREHVPERRLKNSRPAIGWSRQVTSKLMGKWIETPPMEKNVILINKLLDDARVPSYYLEFNVYHEILHDLFSISRAQGRWIQHSVEFQKREKSFPHYARALEWEATELQKLVTFEHAAS